MDFPFSLLEDTFVFDESSGVTARKQYQDHLNKNCRTYLPPGKRFLVEEGMGGTLVERVVNIPFPRISVQRLSQIKDYIDEDLASRSPYWEMAVSRLNELEEDCERRVTHGAVWRIIKSTHQEMVNDYKWLIHSCTTLEADPSRFGEIPIDSELAPRIGRFLGTCTEGHEEGYDDLTGEAELEKMREDHYDYYVPIRATYELYNDEVLVGSSAWAEDGKKAAQHLRTLVNMISSYNPEHDLDAEIFQSLKQRAVRVYNGGRKRSPPPLEGIDDSGSEDYNDCDSAWE